MSVWDCFKAAIAALRLNALRSILTTLGIIIGVASVVVMVAVGNGARDRIDRIISNFGTNVLTVFPGSSRFGGRRGGAGTALPLAEGDVQAIRNEVPGVIAISGRLRVSGQIVNGGANWATGIEGVHADYLIIQGWSMADGVFFDSRDVTAGVRKAVIGQTIVRELFGGGNPIGSSIRVRNVPFEVVGVLETLGPSAWGSDQDDVIVVPISAARARLAGRNAVIPNQVGSIYVKLADTVDLEQAENDIVTLMRTRRGIRPGQADDFRVMNRAQFIRSRTETVTIFSWLLSAIAFITLIVGGIGIMNIMLVSVTERTREIGLRMAVGARPGDIMLQFLIEAITLCMVGGLIGLALGVAIAMALPVMTGWAVIIDPTIFVIAFGASATVGICFGFFPARRASQLNPIDALRYE